MIVISALDKKRKRIDAIDSRLAPLLAERFGVVRSLAGLKKTARDAAREGEVTRHAARLVKERALRPAVKAVYKEIFAQGRRLQNDYKA